MQDIIIIGAGPIGIYASTLASLHNLKGMVIEALDNVGGQLTTLYPEKDIIDLPGFNRITATEFISNLLNQNLSKSNHLDLHVDEKVLSIKKIENGYCVTTNKNSYETRTILLATGNGSFTPRKIGLENEDKFDNIYYSAKNRMQFKNRRVCVLGGGDSAVDIAIMLKDVASSVSIVHRRDEFRAQSSSVEIMEKKGVNIYKPFHVVELIGDKSVKSIRIQHVETKKDYYLEVDDVIVNYGIDTSRSIFDVEKTSLGIKVDTTYQTSSENIFAVGNGIYYPGKVKNITAGFGEAVIAITRIDQIINPNKNIPVHF